MKVLITAGPTWIKIDDVRIITSIFTGATGVYLAQEFRRKKCTVTLIVNSCWGEKIKGVEVLPFKYFDDFKKIVAARLKKKHYDIIIHTAAVSDYKLKVVFKGKIPSSRKELILNLAPAEKLVKMIRRQAEKSVLVQFKLEAERKGLIEKAYRSLKENKADFVVANALSDLKEKYKAFLIDKDKNITALNSKKSLFSNLYKRLIDLNPVVKFLMSN